MSIFHIVSKLPCKLQTNYKVPYDLSFANTSSSILTFDIPIWWGWWYLIGIFLQDIILYFKLSLFLLLLEPNVWFIHHLFFLFHFLRVKETVRIEREIFPNDWFIEIWLLANSNERTVFHIAKLIGQFSEKIFAHQYGYLFCFAYVWTVWVIYYNLKL